MLGHSAEALAGTRIVEHVHPDDRDWVAAHYRRLLEHPGPSGDVLVRWLHRDGGFRWVESRAANLLQDPAVDGIVMNSRDVTDRIALQQQLPERGLVASGEFIAVAEQAGLIELLGTWILREAVRQAAEWRTQDVGDGAVWVAVNLSVQQLASPALVGEAELALRDHGLPPELLVLELTESAVMRDVVTAAQRLDALKALGVRIAVDDFGEGHSSLAYLASLPLDLLKIAEAFVDPIAAPDGNVALVELPRSFGLRTVAEGIEERGQMEPLQRLGCDLAQGYLFARPASAASVATLAGTHVSRSRGGAAPRGATRAS